QRIDGSFTRNTRRNSAALKMRTEERNAHSSKKLMVVIFSCPFARQSLPPVVATVSAPTIGCRPVPPETLRPILRKSDRQAASQLAQPRCAWCPRRGTQKFFRQPYGLRSPFLPASARSCESSSL